MPKQKLNADPDATNFDVVLLAGPSPQSLPLTCYSKHRSFQPALRAAKKFANERQNLGGFKHVALRQWDDDEGLLAATLIVPTPSKAN